MYQKFYKVPFVSGTNTSNTILNIKNTALLFQSESTLSYLLYYSLVKKTQTVRCMPTTHADHPCSADTTCQTCQLMLLLDSLIVDHPSSICLQLLTREKLAQQKTMVVHPCGCHCTISGTALALPVSNNNYTVFNTRAPAILSRTVVLNLVYAISHFATPNLNIPPSPRHEFSHFVINIITKCHNSTQHSRSPQTSLLDIIHKIQTNFIVLRAANIVIQKSLETL